MNQFSPTQIEYHWPWKRYTRQLQARRVRKVVLRNWNLKSKLGTRYFVGEPRFAYWYRMQYEGSRFQQSRLHPIPESEKRFSDEQKKPT